MLFSVFDTMMVTWCALCCLFLSENTTVFHLCIIMYYDALEVL
jgi:hypothetical protein